MTHALMEGHCERCGRQLDIEYEITTLGAGVVHVIYEACRCPDLVGVCPFCETALDAQERCQFIDCFFLGQRTPVPVMLERRRVRSIPPPPRPFTPRTIRR